MDSILFSAIHDQMPKFNPSIANGLAIEQLKHCEAFVDETFQSVSMSFPDGLKYDGYMRCTPQEEYNIMTDKRGTKRFCEISKSDMYLVKYMFSFNGKPLFPRYLYLPYVNDAGILSIRGSRWSIIPVVSDNIVSVEPNNIFIVLNCAKLKFERCVQNYRANNSVETVSLVWSAVHNEYRKKKGKDKSSVDAFTTLAHYLFAKFGVKETFKKYANTNVIIGTDDINEVNYPKEKFVICSTLGNKPPKLKEKYYQPTNLKLAVPVNKYNLLVKSLIGGFFYVVEHFPDRFMLEYFNKEDELVLWKILLGYLIFPAGSSEGDLINKVEEHFYSLNEYIDEMDKNRLNKDGIHVDDIYELFVHLTDTMHDRINNCGNSVSSMYGKQLTILRYLLYDIRAAIVNAKFNLNKSKAKRPLTVDEINKILNRELRREIIAGINRDHGEVVGISCPGDNKILKVTSNILMQTKSGSNSKSKSKGKVNDPSKKLHSSIAEVASFINLPHSDPTGRSRVNPYLMLDSDGSVLRNEQFVEILDDVQKKIEL